MVELAKVSMRQSLGRMRQLAACGPRTPVDIVKETSTMTVRILLICALGKDFSDMELDYWHGGRLEKRCVSFSLRETFHGLI